MSPAPFNASRLLRKCCDCRGLFRRYVGRPPHRGNPDACPRCNQAQATLQRQRDAAQETAWIEQQFAKAKAANRASGRFSIRPEDCYGNSPLANAVVR